ncbi:hypothetical protein [Cohaesibacter haloalkalitolerans]|uniref:hypothetical protein n=1 Tax=Cohaesibacter haloalkalitolerans TaxID=1162980 RepID=UPI0013C44EA4|nr:hypothetical protein [Cohaesibacter haloalkalitolerans]
MSRQEKRADTLRQDFPFGNNANTDRLKDQKRNQRHLNKLLVPQRIDSILIMIFQLSIEPKGQSGPRHFGIGQRI